MTILKRSKLLTGLKVLATAALFSAGLSAAAVAAPVTYSFVSITSNDPDNPATGEAQFFVEVDDAGDGLVSFNFYNTGPTASSITDIYFDGGGMLVSLDSLIDADDGTGGDMGVDFSPLASPGNVPGANNADPTFVTTVGLSADSDAPAVANGINPGENLVILLATAGDATFADIIAALDDRTIRTALHAQSMGTSAGSEGFVNGARLDGCMSGDTSGDCGGGGCTDGDTSGDCGGGGGGGCTDGDTSGDCGGGGCTSGDCSNELPEPGPLGMLGLGLVALALARRKHIL